MLGSCSLCGSATRPLFVKQEIPYYRCAACGFAYSEPSRNPNLESRLEDYETAYLDYLAGSEDDERNFEATCGWMTGFRALEGCQLLDVGCGSGSFVRHLRGRGVDAWGVEPSKALFEHFLSDGPWFANSDLQDLRIPDAPDRFDVLTAFDVIEHVPGPAPFLEAASRALVPEGWLFRTTTTSTTSRTSTDRRSRRSPRPRGSRWWTSRAAAACSPPATWSATCSNSSWAARLAGFPDSSTGSWSPSISTT